MYVGDDRFALLQVGGSEPIQGQHDEGRTYETGEHKDDKNEQFYNFNNPLWYDNMAPKVSIVPV